MVGRHPVRPARTARAFHPTVSSPLQAPPLAGACRSGGAPLRGPKKKSRPRRETRGGGGGEYGWAYPPDNRPRVPRMHAKQAHTSFAKYALREIIWRSDLGTANRGPRTYNSRPDQSILRCTKRGGFGILRKSFGSGLIQSANRPKKGSECPSLPRKAEGNGVAVS